MDDRQQPAPEKATPNRSAPSAPGKVEPSPNGHHDRQGSEPPTADRRSSPDKAPLTDRERKERWPLG